MKVKGERSRCIDRKCTFADQMNMMKIRYVLPSLTFLMVISLSSCKKSRNEPEPAKTLFTVEFADNYVKKQLYGFIIVSDPQGKVLGDTICNSNGRFPVFMKSSSPVPASLTVTVGYYEVIMHILTIYLDTYTQVPPFGEWKVKGNLPDTLGHVFISLLNLPTVQGPTIYSDAGYSDLTFKNQDKELMLYHAPDDIYVKINTAAGRKFKWAVGGLPSGTYSLDMSDAAPASSHSIRFPFAAEDYDISLSGVKDADYGTRLPYLTDRVISDGIIDSVDLSFPPSVFQGFLTDIMIRESYASDLQWLNHVAGSIPDQFRKIEATVNSVSASAGEASLNTSGTYRMAVINWQFLDKDHTLYNWNIYGPETASSLSLPAVSPGLSKALPSLKLDSMSYISTEIRDYPNLGSYGDVLRLLFDPTRVNAPADFEMRAVKKILPGKSGYK